MISGDPLAGRDGELATIRRALSGGGNTSGVVIVGAAGVGKTRLAREVLALAERAGERTNWIVGTESARSLPLGAFTAFDSVVTQAAFGTGFTATLNFADKSEQEILQAVAYFAAGRVQLA